MAEPDPSEPADREAAASLKKQAVWVLLVVAIGELGFWTFTAVQKHSKAGDDSGAVEAGLATPSTRAVKP